MDTKIIGNKDLNAPKKPFFDKGAMAIMDTGHIFGLVDTPMCNKVYYIDGFDDGKAAQRDDCEKQLKERLDRGKIACVICRWNKDCDSSPILGGIPKANTCSIKLGEANQIIKLILEGKWSSCVGQSLVSGQ